MQTLKYWIKKAKALYTMKTYIIIVGLKPTNKIFKGD